MRCGPTRSMQTNLTTAVLASTTLVLRQKIVRVLHALVSTVFGLLQPSCCTCTFSSRRHDASVHCSTKGPMYTVPCRPWCCSQTQLHRLETRRSRGLNQSSSAEVLRIHRFLHGLVLMLHTSRRRRHSGTRTTRSGSCLL